MKITKKEVMETAELARLEFKEEEIERFMTQLGDILEYVEGLNELDTTNVKPTSHVLDIPTPLREDVVEQEISPEQAVENAPLAEDNFFLVPKVIED